MSATTTSSAPILNPFTPLAFVPPGDAAQATIARDLLAITVGALLWDVIMSIPDEVRMCRKRDISISDAVYFLSRITTTGSVISAFVFTSTPLDDCHVVIRIACWLSAFSVCLNSALFLLRTFGVFYESNTTKILFVALWLSTFTSFIAPFSANGKHVGPTKQCTANSLTTGDALGYLLVAVFDTVVFLAITIRILSDNARGGWNARIELFFDRHRMGNVYRTVLQTGQLYYLVTVGMNIFAIAMIFSPRIPPGFKMLVTSPNISLQNSMACRVFRLLRLTPTAQSSGSLSRAASVSQGQPSSIHFNIPTIHRSSESDGITASEVSTNRLGSAREKSESTREDWNPSQKSCQVELVDSV